MSRQRFVALGVQRLQLSEGDWVEIKAQLGIAESKRIESALFRGLQSTNGSELGPDTQPGDVEMRLDATHAYMTKLKTYLIDWSFKDNNDKPVKCTHAAIDALDPDTAEEIISALNDYLNEREMARAADPFSRKNSTEQSA